MSFLLHPIQSLLGSRNHIDPVEPVDASLKKMKETSNKIVIIMRLAGAFLLSAGLVEACYNLSKHNIYCAGISAVLMFATFMGLTNHYQREI